MARLLVPLGNPAMKKKRTIALLAAVVLFVGSSLLVAPIRLWVFGLLRGEPFYRGQPASYWGNMLQGRGAPRPKPLPLLSWFLGPDSDHGPAFFALMRGDPDAIPVLVALLRDERPGVRLDAICLLERSTETGRDDPRAKAALPALHDLAQSQHIGESQEARFLLNRLDPQPAAEMQKEVLPGNKATRAPNRE